MNLSFDPPSESEAPPETNALVVPLERVLPPRRPGVALYGLVDAFSADEEASACRSALSAPATFDGRRLSCPHGGREALEARVRAAARLTVDGLLLDRPEAWYEAEDGEAGFCAACRRRFSAELAHRFGEQFEPFDALAPFAAGTARPPLWRQREALRLHAGVQAGVRLVRAARDETRSFRNAETSVGARLLGFSPASVALARSLDFAVLPAFAPSPDAVRTAAYEVFRAALSERPLVALADDDTARTPALVAQAARLAALVDADFALPADAPAASQEALLRHRSFWKGFRAEFRPTQPLAEALLLYAPDCDHWTEGRHGRGVLAAAEALTRLGVQYRVVLKTPATGSEPLILVDAAALSFEESGRIAKRVQQGAGAIVLGDCGACDEEGHALEGPFRRLDPGLNQEGGGTVFRIADKDAQGEGLSASLQVATESLIGRGRRTMSLSRASVTAKLFLEPDKKLDVRLVGRAFDPVRGTPERVSGVVLYLSGAAASRARTGYLFTTDGKNRSVPLVPFGMGVQARLPDFDGAAVLTVAR